MNIQLTPSYVLTTDHPCSSYDIPVLVNRSTGDAFGPGHMMQAYPSWPWQPAAHVVIRMLHGSTDKEALKAASLYLAQWPDGPQLSSTKEGTTP
jgi:hypothetical protein